MSRLLINEHPLQVLPSLAVKVGLNEAIFVQQLHYWLDINRKANRNVIDGTVWSYNTYEQWREQFPFWSQSTLRRTVKSCEKQGLIRSAHLSKDSRDRTLYYTVSYQRLKELELGVDAEEAPESSDQAAEQVDPTNQAADASIQNEHMEESASTSPSVQNEHMQVSTPENASGQSEHIPSGQNDHMQVGQNEQMQVGQNEQMLIKEQRLLSETSPETSPKTSSSSPESEGNLEGRPSVFTAAELEDIKKGRYSHRINSAINERTRAELLKEMPARKAWQQLPEEEKALAFKAAQARKQNEQTSKSFSTVLKEELDKACNLQQQPAHPSTGFVPQHISDADYTQRDRDRREIDNIANLAYEEEWDAALQEGVAAHEAEVRATRAMGKARQAAIARLADARARDQQAQEQQRKNELLTQALTVASQA